MYRTFHELPNVPNWQMFTVYEISRCGLGYVYRCKLRNFFIEVCSVEDDLKYLINICAGWSSTHYATTKDAQRRLSFLGDFCVF